MTINKVDLIDRGIYTLISRNLKIGVYNIHKGYFVGIRNKFNTKFLDVEYLYDPTGTARPLELIEYLPIDLDPVDGWWVDENPQWIYNQKLYDYIERFEAAT